jgi:hypothetical protein
VAAPDTKGGPCPAHLRPALLIERKKAQRANLDANSVAAAFFVVNFYQAHREFSMLHILWFRYQKNE